MEGHDIVLKTFHKVFKESKFDWITYLSATNIYGNANGEWVDENKNPNPTSSRGIARLNAEKAWLEYFKNYKIPLQIFRLAGIYSNENNVLQRLKAGTQNSKAELKRGSGLKCWTQNSNAPTQSSKTQIRLKARTQIKLEA